MSKFEIGDRIAVYWGSERFTGNVGNLVDSLIIPILDCDSGIYDFKPVHPSQCRKLKPKKEMKTYVVSKQLLEALSNVEGQMGDEITVVELK